MARQTVSLRAVASDRGGRPIQGRTVRWTVATASATIDEATGALTGIVSGTNSVTAEIDGVRQTVAFRVDPGIPQIAAVPFLWPAGAFKDLTGLIAQNFDEFDDWSPESHTGFDIRAPGGVAVRAAAPGWLVLVQERTSSLCHAKPCDHSLGNVVILGHQTTAGVVYSLYAHLQDNSLDFTRLRESSKLSSDCTANEASRRYSCLKGSVLVDRGEFIGTVGNTGSRGADPYPTHLHFEIRRFEWLGTTADDSGEYGYTPSSARSYGFADPVEYFHVVSARDAGVSVRPTTADSKLLMGPGALKADIGRNQYRALASSSAADIYTVTGFVDSQSGEPTCANGWYRLERQNNGATFYDVLDVSGRYDKGRVKAAWACKDDLTPATSGGDEWRAVLTWGGAPNDLDSHLTGPTAAGGRFWINYANIGNCSAAPFACLDE
ncbi:MAG: M23 family metallopeptidase, partial [Gemmatimonas sp.]